MWNKWLELYTNLVQNIAQFEIWNMDENIQFYTSRYSKTCINIIIMS